MQTAIVIIIVAAAGFYLIRRFYNSIAKGSPSTCGCGCDGCGPVEKNNCTEIKNQIQKRIRASGPAVTHPLPPRKAQQIPLCPRGARQPFRVYCTHLLQADVRD